MIVLLNGASSAGKTTLCQELQEVLDGPYIHLEEDRFVYGTYHARYLQPGIVAETFAKTMLGYYRSLVAFVSAGHGVLADTGLYSADLLDVCVREFAGQTVWLVGVHCSLEELERRERGRADRTPGLAREQFYSIHAGVRYDVQVDTSQASLRDCALQIKAVVESSALPTALAALQAQRARADP